jgi:Chaperone of endosialidase
MKNRNTTSTIILVVLACLAIAPVVQARQQSEDRGNGNSAAEGVDALNLSTTGSNNTAHGWFSLFSNTSGSSNTADGFQTLYRNTTGNYNTAGGVQSLHSNISGWLNTAYGFQALYSNTTADRNTAYGFRALYQSTGQGNTASGDSALYSNAGGGFNTGIGISALSRNTSGIFNTAIGAQALFDNTIGNDNTVIGGSALSHNISGNGNTALGVNAGRSITTADNVIAIGSPAEDVSNSTWIENIYGVPTQSGTTAPVIVSVDGQLGTVASSERFKKDIASMEKASDAILSLRPVTFHYKRDAKGTPQFGLIAEEVAKVNPALVLPDKEGRPYTVRCDAVNAMLLNEFLKAHRRAEQQQARITQLEATVAKEEAAIAEQHRDFERKLAQQETQIEALTSGLQKVSAQLEMMKPGTQMVINEP